MKRVLAALLLVACACSQSAERSAPMPEGAMEAKVPEAATWVASMVEAHRLADAARDDRTRQEALAALRALAERAAVPGVAADDLTEARQDLFARAAELSLTLGKPADATQLAKHGLAVGEHAGPFQIQLYFALADSQRALGDAPGADRTLDDARKFLRAR